MAHSARWRCTGCDRELGTATDRTLTLEGLLVQVTPRAVVVMCPDCRAERLWTQKRSA